MNTNAIVVHHNRNFTHFNLSPKAPQPVVGQDLLIIEASRPHSDTPHSVSLVEEWSARGRDLYWTTHNTKKRHPSITPAELEPTIPTSERPLGSAHSVMECTNCLKHLQIAYTQYGVTVCMANQRTEVALLQGSSINTFGRLSALVITLEDF
jgi:hypothetical protein